LFQIIVDEAGAFVGTITDGDVRRAVLMGTGLSDPASQCVFRDATIALSGDSDREISRKLDSLGHARPYVPILGADGQITSIAFREVVTKDNLFGLVMAGGRGTRLGDRTNKTPKPLLNVGGKPILERVLQTLDEASIRQIFVSAHYLADQIEEFVANWSGDAELSVLLEKKPLGTAGSLRLIPESVDCPALVVNADVLTNLNIRGLVTYHTRHGNDATVAVATHEVIIPYGVIELTEDGLFNGIQEKPRMANFVASGIYLLEPAFRALIADNQHLDMPELLQKGKKIGLRIGLYPVHEYWTDIGHPEQLDAAEKRMRGIR
jgi:NDP-sugar pyrophosphorylase family protein